MRLRLSSSKNNIEFQVKHLQTCFWGWPILLQTVYISGNKLNAREVRNSGTS